MGQYLKRKDRRKQPRDIFSQEQRYLLLNQILYGASQVGGALENPDRETSVRPEKTGMTPDYEQIENSLSVADRLVPVRCLKDDPGAEC